MKSRILYIAGISHFMRPKNGGQIRTHHILKQLCTEFKVDIFSPYLPNSLEGFGISISKNVCPNRLKYTLRLAHKRGFSRLIDWYFTRRGERSGHHLQNEQFCERSILEHHLEKHITEYQYVFYDTSRYAPLSPSESLRAKAYLIAHNVDSVLHPDSSFHSALETNLTNLFNAVITCTPQDSIRFQSLSPGLKCIVWPNGTAHPTTDKKSDTVYDIIFVGALNYKPNIEAVEFLIDHAFPLLHSKGLQLCIVGRSPSADLASRIINAGITLIPDAPDLTSLYYGSKLAIVPLTTGSGSRLKIAEALIHGLPVISTPIGAEGYPEKQSGLTRIPCMPASKFVEAIERELSNLSPHYKNLITKDAQTFLWENTIDLSLLPLKSE